MDLLDSFVLPDGALEAIRAKGLKLAPIDDGVNMLTSGHDRGLSYRFFYHNEYNPTKSEILGYEYFDRVEMIEWFIDRKNKVTERVSFLPPALLKFNRHDECVGGRYQEAYERFKKGEKTSGFSLRNWGVLEDNEVASLEAMGIFTVEQYAEYPDGRILGTMPESFVEAHKRAKQHVAGQEARDQDGIRAQELIEIKGQNEELIKQLEAMKAEIEEFKKNQKEKKRDLKPQSKEVEDLLSED